MLSVYEEGCGMVTGHSEAAGCSPPLLVSSHPHLQVSGNLQQPVFQYLILFEVLSISIVSPSLSLFRLSCDLRVVTIMRDRALGNSATQLYTKLCESHSEAWMQRTMQYLGECEHFLALGTGSFHHHQPCRRCPHRHG